MRRIWLLWMEQVAGIRRKRIETVTTPLLPTASRSLNLKNLVFFSYGTTRVMDRGLTSNDEAVIEHGLTGQMHMHMHSC